MINTKCPHCGHEFVAPDFEYNATIESAPVECPKCGHVFQPENSFTRALYYKLPRKLINKLIKH